MRVVLVALAAAAVVAGSAGHASAAKRCPSVCLRATLDVHVRCLRVVQPCNPHYNWTKSSYPDYHFYCAARTSSDPNTLFRIAQPGPAPSTCPGIGSDASPSAPSFRGVGQSPFWVGPYLGLDPDASIWRYGEGLSLRGNDGWAVKFLWYLEQQATPGRVSITELVSGQPIAIVGHGERSTALVLEPSTAFVYPEHTWGSYVVFPRAGCYRLDAQWAGGSWSLVFSFG